MSNNTAENILATANLTKRFGGLVPVDHVNLVVRQKNEALAIIGPNGAGKTTLINLISGYLQPDDGSIEFLGDMISKWAPDRRVKFGIARTFQLTSVFEELKVLDNISFSVSVTADSNRLNRMIGSFVRRFPGQQVEEEALRMLKTFGLEEYAHRKTRELPYGEKRKLEVAMAYALKPKLLLLDEPFAGLSESEIPSLIEILKQIRGELLSLIIVEHKISWLKGLVQRTVVMHEGKVIADATYDDAIRDATVSRAYWGV